MIDKPELTADEEAELVARINANPNLHPMTNTPSPDEDRELKLDIRMSLEALAANEATVDETFNDITAVVLSDRAKLEEIVAVANELVNGGGLQLRSGNVPRLTVVETSDKTDPHYRLCTLLDALNRSTDRAT